MAVLGSVSKLCFSPSSEHPQQHPAHSGHEPHPPHPVPGPDPTELPPPPGELRRQHLHLWTACPAER